MVCSLDLHFLAIVSLLGALQGLIVVVNLLSMKADNERPNRFLALFMLLFAWILGETYLFSSGLYQSYPNAIGLTGPTEFLLAPLLYFYTSSRINSDYRVVGAQWLHCIPYIILLAIYSPFFGLDAEQKILYFEYAWVRQPTDHPIVQHLINLSHYQQWLSSLQFAIYFYFIYKKLNQYAVYIRENYSSIEQISLDWLKNLVTAVFILWVVFVVTSVLPSLTDFADVVGQYFMAVPVLLVVVIYLIGFMSMRHPVVFAGLAAYPEALLRDNQVTEKKDDESGEKYQRSGLATSDAKMYKSKLLKIMEEQRPYLKSTLTLGDLADLIDLVPNHLSQVINSQFQQHFFDFVNQYRVQAAKTLLLDAQERSGSALAIAMEVGFNSKSSFYSAFKKHTGMTPIQYKKAHSG